MSQIADNPPATVAHPPSARGFFHRLRQLYLGQPSQQESVECRALVDPITVTAQGDAFDFRIYATFTWRSVGIRRDELCERIRYFGVSAVSQLRFRAAELARNYPPHFVDQFEEELKRDLAQRRWRFEQDGVTLTCEARVLVQADEQVRRSLQPIWQQRIEMESRHDLGMRHAILIRERTEVWAETIAKLQDNPYCRHAADLTEVDFAKVYREMLETRENASSNLVRLLQEAIRDHEAVGLYEFAETYDKALKAFQKQAGLTAHDLDAEDGGP